MARNATHTCAICHGRFSPLDVTPIEAVRPSIREIIGKSFPDFGPGSLVCTPDLNRFRSQHVQHVLETERGELTRLETQVIQSLKDGEVVAQNVNRLVESQIHFGDRVSDRLASFGGSWAFLGLFMAALLIWMALNRGGLPWTPIDPYPFVFLNLILSCVAAVQAPLILMSQNRQSKRDRLTAEHDYQTNLKAEVEIRNLTTKVDQLLSHQWQRLLEIQATLMEMVAERHGGKRR